MTSGVSHRGGEQPTSLCQPEEPLHDRTLAYLLLKGPFQRLHPHLLFPESSMESRALRLGLGANLSNLFVGSGMGGLGLFAEEEAHGQPRGTKRLRAHSLLTSTKPQTPKNREESPGTKSYKFPWHIPTAGSNSRTAMSYKVCISWENDMTEFFMTSLTLKGLVQRWPGYSAHHHIVLESLNKRPPH